MVNTNSQFIYSRISANIETIIGEISRNLLNLHPNINDCLNVVSGLSESVIKMKIWRTSKRLHIFTKEESSNPVIEAFVLKLYDDASSSDSLHSFDFRAAIHNMCILIYYTNKKL